MLTKHLLSVKLEGTLLTILYPNGLYVNSRTRPEFWFDRFLRFY